MASVFSMTTKVLFGEGSLGELSDQIFEFNSNPRVLICTDEGITNTYIINKVTASLEEKDIKYVVFSGVIPNPTMKVVYQGLNTMKEFNAQIIIGLGGGSSIDAAKAIAAVYSNEGNLIDFEGREKLHTPTVPLIAIPTTYGTGSEANNATLITHEIELRKVIIVSKHLQPDIAIVDAELMIQIPQKIAASTAIDALTHAIESYASVRSQPISDALNLYAINLIIKNAPQAVMSEKNVEATSKMAIASTCAGMAFGNTGLGLIHAIAHALGGIYNVAHGEANAILLPHVMRFNLPAVPEKYKQIGILFDTQINFLSPIEGAIEACNKTKIFCELLEAPKHLKDIGIEGNNFDKIAEYALKDGNISNNCRPAGKEDIVNILKKAF